MKMNEIQFPPVGGGRRYVIMCNGAPFAGYDKLDDAKKCLDMYKSPTGGKGSDTFASKASWSIEDKG